MVEYSSCLIDSLVSSLKTSSVADDDESADHHDESASSWIRSQTLAIGCDQGPKAVSAC